MLAKHEPELATQLTVKTNDHSDFKGLTIGKEQYEKEVMEWTKRLNRNIPTKDNKDISHER